MKVYVKFFLYGLFFLVKSIFSTTAPLKVLFVTDFFPYEIRRYIDNQITGFIDAGVDVTILAKSKSAYVAYPLVDQYNLMKITFYQELPSDKRCFDIIYCQFSPLCNELITLKKAGLLQGKIVVCFRNGAEFKILEKNIAECKLLFKFVDLILVVCEAFKQRLINYGCSKKKILVHHSGIETEAFHFQKRKLNNNAIKLITIGRLEMKGHKFVIDAIAKVKLKFPNIKYSIFGEGKDDFVSCCDLLK